MGTACGGEKTTQPTSLPGRLQTVYRAELLAVVTAMEQSRTCRRIVSDNKGVVLN